MKIVFVTSVFYPYFDVGGAVRTFYTARWLVRLGHEVTVLCAKTSPYPDKKTQSLPNYEEVDGVKIIRAPKPYNPGVFLASLPALFDQYSQLRHMIKDGAVDIVVSLTYRSSIPVFAAAKGKIPCIANILAIILNGKPFGFKGWRNYEPSKRLVAVMGCLAENIMLRIPFDGFMVSADWLGKDLKKYYPKKPIKNVYGGIELEELTEVVSGDKKPHQIVFLGSLIKHKNILDAIEATKIARKEIGDLKLVIISSGGEYESFVEELCENNDLFEYHKRPSREQIIRILKESSLLIHPSKSETFAIAIAEALACDTPYIAYDVPSMKEVVQRMPGGILVPFEDRVALAEGICKLISDRSMREELSRQGKSAVEEKFTWEKTARRVEEALEGFLE